MKFVVDTNVLFTQFWKDSFTKELFNDPRLELYSPEFALEEIKHHMQDIIDKTAISKDEFIRLRLELTSLIEFIPLSEYSEKLKEVQRFIPDSSDIDFFGLAIKLECPLWSNDSELKKQSKVEVFTTEEIIGLL